MSNEKVIEIKINDVTYIVSEVNRNDDHLYSSYYNFTFNDDYSFTLFYIIFWNTRE